MPVETRGEKQKKLEKESRERPDGVTWIEDFPLELIEKIARHLEPKDVLKLMMVSKRLYSGYSRDQSIVFGDHVNEIELVSEVEDGCRIKKHSDSQQWRDFDRRLHLIKRVTACDKLLIRMWKDTAEKPISEAHKTILEQFKSVNDLDLYVKSIADLTKFFAHFHASVNGIAKLDIRLNSFGEGQSFSDLLENFIGTQLADCENIEMTLNFEELLHVCYRALQKTRVKRIEMKESDFLDVQWVVEHGIPSQNSEAAFYAWFYDSLEKREEIISFLTKYPGMKEIVGKNRVSLLGQANNLWEDYCDEEHLKDLCFRRKVDLTKDCIYVIRYHDEHPYEEHFTAFFAFYILSTPTSMK